jgi:predicted O-linked N-acetylglucosamine transferase (SPINDLY family)
MKQLKKLNAIIDGLTRHQRLNKDDMPTAYQKLHTYELTIRFSSEKAVDMIPSNLTQYENGLGYFVEMSKDSINNTFVYGSGKTTLKKLTSTKRSTARKHKRKKKTAKKSNTGDISSGLNRW